MEGGCEGGGERDGVGVGVGGGGKHHTGHVLLFQKKGRWPPSRPGLKAIKLSDGGEDLPNFLGKCVWRADVVPQLYLTHEAPRGRAKRCAATARLTARKGGAIRFGLRGQCVVPPGNRGRVGG